MRFDNLAMLNNTLDILEKRSYEYHEHTVSLKLSRDQIEEVQVYLPEDVKVVCRAMNFKHTHKNGKCVYSCENTDSYTLARERIQQSTSEPAGKDAKPILVLNLANPVNPGGGVRRGAKAQEEDLCRKSSLLISLESEKAKAYYEYNRGLNTFMGSDALMIHPQVEIIKDEKGDLLPETAIVAVLTCAAPMLTYGMEGMTQEQYETMLYGRICGMLKVAAYLGYRNLVLGAFGCGAFRNDARVVSDIFYKVLKEFDFDGMTESDMFDRIDFAILCRPENEYNLNEFSRNFADFYRDREEHHPGEKESELSDSHHESRKSGNENKGNAKWSERSTVNYRNIGNQKAAFFWKDNEENGWFSNWYRRKFIIDDFEYIFVEQYMMARKAKLFHDAKRYTAILRSSSQRECKELGRLVTPFDSEAWSAVRYEVVKTANKAKFEQNPDLKIRLLETGDAILAEASPRDYIWGIGLDASTAAGINPAEWPGQNLLGRILMELRDEFASEG